MRNDLTLQIHDELVPEEKLESISAMVCGAMESDVPLKVNLETGRSLDKGE
jgi:DNA polymerase I-like protein with 3'-5' exonuclease and polymerase domains